MQESVFGGGGDGGDAAVLLVFDLDFVLLGRTICRVSLWDSLSLFRTQAPRSAPGHMIQGRMVGVLVHFGSQGGCNFNLRLRGPLIGNLESLNSLQRSGFLVVRGLEEFRSGIVSD